MILIFHRFKRCCWGLGRLRTGRGLRLDLGAWEGRVPCSPRDSRGSGVVLLVVLLVVVVLVVLVVLVVVLVVVVLEARCPGAM